MLLFLLTMETPPGLTQQLNRCLIQMAQKDAAGLEELYRLASSGIYAYALSVVKNPQDASDIMQDTFVSAYHHANQYEDHGKPMAWLITIARNLCYALLRRQNNFSDIQEEEVVNSVKVDSSQGQVENAQLLEFCLSVLGEDERQILVLHSVLGMKHREIAKTMGMPLSTVLSKYHRGIRKCREFLEKEEQ